MNKQKQENLLKETLKKIDIVICTALIPGKKAPLIIKKDMRGIYKHLHRLITGEEWGQVSLDYFKFMSFN